MNKLEGRITRLEQALGGNKNSPMVIIVRFVSPGDLQPPLLGYEWESAQGRERCLREDSEDDEALRTRAKLQAEENVMNMSIRVLYEMRHG